MRTLLAVDPGKHFCGWAFFVDGVLHSCGLDVPDEIALLMHAERLVIELPQIYRASRTKGDPNDLIDVALVVGQIMASFTDVTLIKPRAWKGTVKKEVMTARIESKLTDAEKALIPRLSISLRHNVVDAIGIGLFSLGRLKNKACSVSA